MATAQITDGNMNASKLTWLRTAPEEVIKKYHDGASLIQIANEYCVSIGAIRNLLIANGVPRRKSREPRCFTNDEINDMVTKYQNGAILRDITKYHHTTNIAIKAVLLGKSVHLNHNKDTGRVNNRAFDTLCPQVNYWLGFLFADGWIRDNSSIGLSLCGEDKDHVEKFRNFVNLYNPVHIAVNNGYTSAAVEFRSRDMASKLVSYGIVPRKSLICKILHPDLTLDRDFWRGVIDGDGCLHITQQGRLRVTLASGSKEFITQFKNFIVATVLNFNGGVCTSLGRCFVIHINGHDAIKLIKYLYKNPCESLHRKQKIANWVMSNESTLKNRQLQYRRSKLLDAEQQLGIKIIKRLKDYPLQLGRELHTTINTLTLR